MDAEFRVGQLLVNRGRLVAITKVGKIKPGCLGVWYPTYEPCNHLDKDGKVQGQWKMPSFCPDYIARQHVAVIGKTVCSQPAGTHFCGLSHIPAEELRWLDGHELPPSYGMIWEVVSLAKRGA